MATMFDPGSRSASDRAVMAAVMAVGAASAALVLWALGDRLFAAIFLAVFAGVAAIVLVAARLRRGREVASSSDATRDVVLMQAAIEDAHNAVVITDRSGAMLCANRAFGDWFPGYPTPPGLPLSGANVEALADAALTAWRDGEATLSIRGERDAFEVEVTRAGIAEDHLVWRMRPAAALDALTRARDLVGGDGGRRLASAGVMAALVDARGRIVAANRVFADRALERAGLEPIGRDFVDLLRPGEDETIRLAADGEDGAPLRLIQIALEEDMSTSAAIFLLLDEGGGGSAAAARATTTGSVHGLLAMLPLGLALAERDGRFLFMNEAFERAAGLGADTQALYPSDLVVKEDKAAVSDAVRRFAAGRKMSGDLAVRLANRPDEPVALTIAGAKGLGDAAVLLSLKDSSEENRLKNQVAQAIKMQAVGQLAGGVAHDFNNILTAIIGHCDLMMMRHTPGDSDYDDIQQIKHNSNRAAALTRQLLAFSRQQTLRPQVLQLPDVISEVSNLLKRLLGETVVLNVKHGRNLGAVRADPGQLEQVIVNLAVNARDAMPGGGTLTLQTYGVSSAEVSRIGSDVLPIADYTALSVTDTGTGIPPEILGKVFEPFFTTKEVGKGTGLGLSTVYGIVKQTGGFIFADSRPGQGTSFTIYLPVHRAEKVAELALPIVREKPAELWGTGLILLVEDEDMVRAVAERALVRQGYRVVTAANGEEALEALERLHAANDPIDLLVSDVVMPTMDGPTMVRHARERWPDLPILFMSGYAEEQLRRSINLDHVAFLPKPFSVQQLAGAVREAMPIKPTDKKV